MEHRQKIDPIRVKHRVKVFRPPVVVCFCGWHRKENTGLLFEKAKDWLLDQYNAHLDERRAERKLELEALREQRRNQAA